MTSRAPHCDVQADQLVEMTRSARVAHIIVDVDTAALLYIWLRQCVLAARSGASHWTSGAVVPTYDGQDRTRLHHRVHDHGTTDDGSYVDRFGVMLLPYSVLSSVIALVLARGITTLQFTGAHLGNVPCAYFQFRWMSSPPL